MYLDPEINRLLNELLPSEEDKLKFIDALMILLKVDADELRMLGEVSKKNPIPNPPEDCLPFLFTYNFFRNYFSYHQSSLDRQVDAKDYVEKEDILNLDGGWRAKILVDEYRGMSRGNATDYLSAKRAPCEEKYLKVVLNEAVKSIRKDMEKKHDV